MKRMKFGLFALVLFAAACGSGDDAEDVLEALDLTDAEIACFTTEYDARGLDMDEVLAADPDDLSTSERQAVLDVAAACAGAEDTTDSGGDDDDAGDSGDDETTGDDDSDDGGDGSRRDYDDLSFIEQAFVDGVTESGGTQAVGICMLEEFEAAGISILDLAQLGETENPPADVMSAIFRCGDELIESGLFDSGQGFFGSSNAEGDTYGDNPELDALWDSCVDGDGSACDELYWSSPLDSEYERFGNTCGDRFPDGVFTCEGAMGQSSGQYGDDPALDALWDGCAAGNLADCDQLYFDSPFGSGYEAFGSTCGETTTESFGSCATGNVDTYGDDPDLDALWDACGSGDLVACDDLWLTSPIGSEYEAFGNTCGQTTTDQFGNCAPTSGSTGGDYGDDPALDALWDACGTGNLAECDQLYFESPFGSAYETFGSTCGGTTDETFGSCTGGNAYGDDVELDALWDACGGGDFAACDDLWLTSPFGSEYEAYGSTCGGRVTEEQFGTCDATLGG